LATYKSDVRRHCGAKGLLMKRCIAVLVAGAGLAVGAPAQAEVFYSWVDVAQKPKLATTSDTLMRKQLCARSEVDGSCLDSGPSAKEKLLLPTEPPELGDPPTVITLPIVDELPPVIDSRPLAPISEQPTTTPVPEPTTLALLAAALFGLLAGKGRYRGRAVTCPVLRT
jgi:hypothetical protein